MHLFKMDATEWECSVKWEVLPYHPYHHSHRLMLHQRSRIYFLYTYQLLMCVFTCWSCMFAHTIIISYVVCAASLYHFLMTILMITWSPALFFLLLYLLMSCKMRKKKYDREKWLQVKMMIMCSRIKNIISVQPTL